MLSFRFPCRSEHSVLLQIAIDYADQFPQDQFPQAARVVQNLFYVDDCLTGASTVEEAAQLRSNLNAMLFIGLFDLMEMEI